MNRPTARRSFNLHALFFLNGFTTAIYLIAFTRILKSLQGHTVRSSAEALVILLIGFVSGSVFFLRASSRIPPHQRFAILQTALAIYGFLIPYLNSPYAKTINVICFLFLLGMAIGGAFNRLGRISTVYGTAAFGAASGCMALFYLFLPEIGVTRSIMVAAGISLLAAMIAFFKEQNVDAGPERTTSVLRVFRPLYLAFFFSGIAVAGYPILWMRGLSMIFGASVYTFATVVSATFLGLGSGCVYGARLTAGRSDPYQLFSMVQFRIALSALFFIGIFNAIPFLHLRMLPFVFSSFPLLQLAQFVLVLALTFYASFFAGSLLPASLKFSHDDAGNVERSPAAAFYICSTIGAVAAIVFVPFFLLPWIGIERSMRIIALSNLVIGILSFRRTAPPQQDRRVLMIGAAVLALLLFLPAWNRLIVNAGFYANAYRYLPAVAQKQLMLPGLQSLQKRKILFYNEARSETVAVIEEKKEKTLLIQARPETSNDSTTDLRNELLLSHLPSLVKGSFEHALLIGIGSGVTAAALYQHHPRSIDCVETEPELAHAAAYFLEENRGVLSRPNVHLTFDDPQIVLLQARGKYDLITCLPGSPSEKRASGLYTREFYQKARMALRSDGVICQRLRLSQTGQNDVIVFLRTIQSEFRHLGILIDQGNLYALGANQPIRLPENSEIFKQDYVGDERLLAYLPAGLPLNSEDQPFLEFSSPRSLYRDDSAILAKMLRSALLPK